MSERAETTDGAAAPGTGMDSEPAPALAAPATAAPAAEAAGPVTDPPVPAASGGRRLDPSEWRLREAFGDPRLLLDAAAPPVAFVVANRVLDLLTAGAVALALAALIVAVRLGRGQQLRYAASGFAGVAVAVGAALWSGQAEAYFAPAAALNAGYALVAVASIAARRPLVAWAAAFAHQRPVGWFWQPHVRPAYTEITWAWVALFTARAVVRYSLMASGQLELLAVAHVALGLPAFAALLLLTYAYLRWRLPRLQASAAPAAQ